VSAVIVGLTVHDATAPGVVGMYPGRAPPPTYDTSAVSPAFDRQRPMSTQVISEVQDGWVNIYSSTSKPMTFDIDVDIYGYFLSGRPTPRGTLPYRRGTPLGAGSPQPGPVQAGAGRRATTVAGNQRSRGVHGHPVYPSHPAQ